MLIRGWLKTLEDKLRSDVIGGDESVDLIEPLTLMAYIDMLAGRLRFDAWLIHCSRNIDRHSCDSLLQKSCRSIRVDRGVKKDLVAR